MDASSAKKLTKAAENVLQNKQWAARKKRQDKEDTMIKHDAESIIKTINKNISADIKKEASKGHNQVEYNFPWANKNIFSSGELDPFINSLRKKGFNISCVSKNIDRGKQDIDYWGCIEEIRSINISWK